MLNPMPTVQRSTLTRRLAPLVPGGSRAKGRAYFINGAVTRLTGDPWSVDAVVNGTRPYNVSIRRRAQSERIEEGQHDEFTASCECPYFTDRLLICKHIWAVLLATERQPFLGGDGVLAARPTITAVTGSVDEDPEFQIPRAPRERPSRGRQPWEKYLGEFARTLSESPHDQPPSRFADAQLAYVIDRAASLDGHGLALDLTSRQRRKNGEWGRPKLVTVSPFEAAQLPDPVDREIVPLLLGATDMWRGNFTTAADAASFRLVGPIVDRTLPLIAQSGRAFLRLRTAKADQLVPLMWDDGPAWTFRLEIVHTSNEAAFSIDGVLQRGDERLAVRQPLMVLDGYLVHNGSLARLDARGAFAWLSQIRRSGPAVIPPDASGQLVDVLARSGVDPHDLPEELQFEIASASPRACLNIRANARRTPETILEAVASFDYGGVQVEPGSTSAVFDRDRRRLIRRNLPFENAALARLAQLGFSRQWDFASSRPVLLIAIERFSQAIKTLVAENWRVEAEGRTFRSAQSMQSEVRSGVDWFELHSAVDFGEGRTLPLPRLLAALRQGHATVPLDDGTVGMVPEEWLRRWIGIADMGEVSGDHIRFTVSQAALLDAALAAQPSIRVDEVFARTREQLNAFEGIAPLDAAPSFRGQLRDYQREALGWLAFLRQFRLGGCLAHDMGLGKTVMVLAWLDRLRAQRQTRGPSLVVAPKSVVFNWKEEAKRFAPQLRVLDFSGTSRWADRLGGHDLVLTTYGTLRRDALRLKDVEFEYVILDEAQTIKNAATAGAKAARLLHARHHLALSGTPIENHLGELWSLFEFLNPGLLGTSSAFARHGIAAARRDPEALDVLARGLRPFILRRTKAQVAPELPQRSELTLHCELHGIQRTLYNELRDHYRAVLLGRIDREGVQRSRMHILEALLRLRQAACHPGLIDRKRANEPSAKFETLLPLLAEVREEGHKALVFSQFTSLLALLRARLDEAGVPYEYLDGKTRDRDARVHRFQDDPQCGLFLISLKAGGLGLNLTAAEYVFLLDPWWNPAVEAQAIDRAHRIGQTRQVFAYRLIAAGTVEDKIAQLQQSKRELADAILRADAPLRDLSREDLDVLLSP
jgi:superfamily II DNA or RNA helicase